MDKEKQDYPDKIRIENKGKSLDYDPSKYKYTCDEIINECNNKKFEESNYSYKYKETAGTAQSVSSSKHDKFDVDLILSQYASSTKEEIKPETKPEKKLITPQSIKDQDQATDSQSFLIQKQSTPINEEDKEERKITEKVIIGKAEIKKSPPALTFNNHLAFVNYVELEHAQNIGKNDQTFVLQGLKQTTSKYNVLQSSQLNALSSLIFKKEGLLNALAVKGDLFITGSNIGKITIFSISSSHEITTLYDKNIKPSSVNCFDISVDKEDLLVGYANGVISLWDLKTFKCKKIMDKVHENCCLNLKILFNDSKSIEFFSSDVDGKVYKTICKSMYFIYTVSSSLIIETKNNPTFILKVMTFSLKDKAAFPELCNIPTTLIIGNLTSIKLFTVDTEITEIFNMVSPSISEYHIYDAGYGIGRVPNSSNELIEKKSELLLAISWSKYIYLYKITPEKGKFSTFKPVGYYINAANILRIGFISNSILFFFDSNKFIKVINTKDIMKGETLNLKAQPKKLSEESRLIDLEVKFQLLFQDPHKNAKAIYTNLIVESDNSVYLFGKKTTYEIKLLNWEKCLNNYQENNDWVNLILMGVDIYHAKISALDDIPQDEAIRRSTIGRFLKAIINQYVLYCLGGNYSEKENQISNCIDIVIEFCIEIESVDFLLDNIQNVFDSRNYGQLFLSRLEPFILCGSLNKVNLSEQHIEGILTIYNEKKQLDLLELLLIHLNINSIDNDKVKEKCTQWGLINPLIYISMNGKNEDFFNPITKIYEIYKKASNKVKFTSLTYDEELYGKKLELLKSSKQYIGCKLLWYINWCIKGIKFPNGILMKLESFRNFVLNTIYWMLNSKVFDELLSCNAFIFFFILKRMFCDERTLAFIVEGFNDSNKKMDTIAKLHTQSMKLFDLDPSTLITLIVFLTKQKLLAQNLQLLYEFVVKSGVYTTIDKELIIESISFLLSTEETKKKTNEELNEISTNIIQILEKVTDFEDADYKYLLEKSDNTNYDLVIIFLFQQDRNWEKCFEIFLEERSKIIDKTQKVYQWINQQLTLQENDKKSFSNLKEQIMYHLIPLGKLSTEKMITLINTWLKDKRKEVMSKLESEYLLQLKYVQSLLKEYQLKDEDTYDRHETEEYESLLLLHIELLCKLGKKKEIFLELKKNVYYPSQDCLQLCLAYNIDDATIYLYQQTGAPVLALNLIVVRLETVYKQIIDNITRNDQSDNSYTILFQLFSSNLDDGKSICTKNSNSNDELWFILLDKCYELYRKTEPLKTNLLILEPAKVYLNDFRSIISEFIKSLLGIICNYVSIIKIIGNVTKNTTAEFKEMKDSLLQIITDYTHQLNILGSARDLLSDCVFKKEYELIKMNSKGNQYQLMNCDYCKLSLSIGSNNEIIAFGCGHKVHQSCSHEENELYLCYICRQTDIETSNMPLEIKKSNIIQSEVSFANQNRSNISKKLKGFDKKYEERLLMVIDESH